MDDDTTTTPTPRERKRLPRAVSLLIVWVVVLGILVALLIPWWLFGLKSSRRATCRTNLMQLSSALSGYAQDFDGVYPWRVGASNPKDAWRDLGLLFPHHVSDSKFFFCPSTKDKRSRLERGFFEKARELDADGGLRPEPIPSGGSREVISYSYGLDARGGTFDGRAYSHLPWTEKSPSTVRIMAGKKAGVEPKGNDIKKQNHRGEGRNVRYESGHVKWRSGKKALDPDPDDDEIGAPDLPDYTAWWSDPPYYGE